MPCTSSQLFALLAIALFSIPTILAACNCRPGYSCDRDIFGQTSCSLLPCNPGNFSPGGSASCQACAPGTFAANSGSAACTPCAPGTFSRLSSSIFCGSATAGNYAPSAGSIDQIPCPAGSYQSLNGQTSCILCPCGSYASLPGSAVCAPCGRFLIPFTGIDLIGSSPRGSTQVTQCGLCPGGSFTSPDALADKTLYNPLDITLVYTNQCCATCPANAISQPGSPTCTVCQAGTAPNSAKTSCTPTATAASSRQKRQIRCAPGFRSCPIPGNKKGLSECVDIMNSLETCGGCPGDVSFQDCSTLDNVASAQCIQGKCVTECPRGYNQTELGCVKASSPREPYNKRSIAGRHVLKITRSI